jgi:hypothetical protein
LRVERGVQLGWATKQVATKEPPVTLVATDGTVCRVAEERYARTDAGAFVACTWQLAAPAQAAPWALALPDRGQWVPRPRTDSRSRWRR